MNAQENTVRDQEVAYRRLGIVGRVTYGYRDKYLAEVNAGYNGSENFAPGNRFGFFPSASVGWVFTEEDWFKSNKVLDYMKLRASYGMVGNDNIGGERFFYESRWGGGGDAKFGINKGGTGNGGGLKEVRNGNPGLTWETAHKFNFGFDVVDELANKYPDKPAMIHLDKHKVERHFTFKQMKVESARTANYFKSLGIKKGDRVMLVLKRHYQFWFAMLGLNKLGAVAIPATNQLQEHDFSYRFKAAFLGTSLTRRRNR